MANLRNKTLEELKAANKISTIDKDKSYLILVRTSARMKKYAREYSKKDKASHLAASKVLLTA